MVAALVWAVPVAAWLVTRETNRRADEGTNREGQDGDVSVLTIRPNTPEVLNSLGTVYRKLGDKAKARLIRKIRYAQLQRCHCLQQLG